MKPYRDENHKAPEELIYHFPTKARKRISAVLGSCINDYDYFKHFMRERIVLNHGELSKGVGTFNPDPIFDHYFNSPDIEALSFINYAFASPGFRYKQPHVDHINAVFKDEGIGYRLTDYQIPQTEENLPHIIRIPDTDLNEHVTRPAFSLLDKFGYGKTTKLLNEAFAKSSAGQLKDALTCASVALEDFLKTVMHKHGVTYNPDAPLKHTVDAAKKGKIIPQHYDNLFIAVGTVRSKYGSAHGNGPTIERPVTQAQADHLLHIVCSNIVFICKHLEENKGM